MALINSIISNKTKAYSTLMKKLMTLGITSAVIALSVGLLSVSGFSINPSSNVGQTTSAEPVQMLGHVTLMVTDAQGQIKEYRQGDNQVVRSGESCAGRLIFGSTATAGSLCTGASTTTYANLALGTSSSTISATATKLGNETNVSGLARAAATTNSVADSSGSGATVTLSKQFTNNGASTNVREAGIFNGTSFNTNGMFAGQTFNTIVLNTNDALTVTWTITVGTQ